MNTPRVSREQAEGLKKVGYDVPTPHYYCEHIVYGVLEETGDECDYNNGYSFHWSRPTLDEAARWLREVKGWHVEVLRVESGWLSFIVPQTKSISCGEFTTHDLAQFAGIDLILKKLTNGTE
jgi:hypothetical protein